MLRWRLFGTSFCIEPSFWYMNALWGYLLSGAVEGAREGVILFILLWIACTFVSTMVHELGHVVMGRIFGEPGSVNLGGLGGLQAGDYEGLRRWQRILVAFAGPGAGFLFLGALVIVDPTNWNFFVEDWINLPSLRSNFALIDKWDPMFRHTNLIYRMAMVLLFVMNLFWNIINLLPIIPMDGGIMFKEVCCMVSPVGGLKFAFGVSFLLALLVTLYHAVVLLQVYKVLKLPVELFHFAFPVITFIMFAMMTFRSFVAMRQVGAMQRHSDYMQDDDYSGPRRGSRGVVEIPPKDPRDFAPPAPGSERPRL